ncbi:hypothetical protein [Aquirhabdus parva]|uniref:Uncharacterized protein n=1 Tax=Aquirhabdus parva TaxID=2283318 RepID=A0A345P793_9GAMM|nr:hypothetical protein [Aquirhabdus parva]AXI03152.1 hypothetical protein HYN46_10055 [Aquirhabdus parva]
MSLEPNHSLQAHSHPSALERSRHVEHVLGQMREGLGDVTQYSSQELYDMISFFKEFCVSLEDQAMSQSPDENVPIRDELR